MELKTIGKRIGLAASILAFGTGIADVNAADWIPKRSDVMGAAPDFYNASWVTGISRDSGKQCIRLGDIANDRRDPTYHTAYYSFPNWSGQKLTAVTRIQASFFKPNGMTNYFCSPRFSLEVMNPAPNDTPSGDVIFLDPAYCSKPATGGWRDADFTGVLAGGSIMDSRGVVYKTEGRISAWKKLVSDPYYAGKRVYFMYLIQDASTGANYVDRIQLDKALFTNKPR